MNNLIGKRVQITGNVHPWSGEKGSVKDIQTTAFGTTGYVVELDNGTSCFVFYPSQLQVLKS